MNLNSAINGRRAVREFTQQAVDEQTIRALIDAALQAPSAMNRQPCRFIVVRDQALLARLSVASKAHMLATMPEGAFSEHMHGQLDNPDFHIFYHAPALILIAAMDEGAWMAEDCAMAAENLMLAAYGSGLGSCWIGLAQGYLRTDAGKDMLAFPANWAAVAPIIIGHPAKTPAPVARKEAEILWRG